MEVFPHRKAEPHQSLSGIRRWGLGWVRGGAGGWRLGCVMTLCSCTWQEGSFHLSSQESHLQLPAGLAPKATMPNRLQSRHAAHRCGAAKPRNLLSHSCLLARKKRRYGIHLSCQLEFSASSVASLWEGPAALQLCSEASAHLAPHPRFVSIFFFPLPFRQREACWSGDSHSPAPLKPILPIKASWFCRNRLLFCAHVGVR